MDLPDLSWVETLVSDKVLSDEDYRQFLRTACCHFLEVCPTAEFADIRFDTKPNTGTEGLHSGIVYKEECHKKNCEHKHNFIKSMASCYASMMKPENAFSLGLGSCAEELMKESPNKKGLLMNVDLTGRFSPKKYIIKNFIKDGYQKRCKTAEIEIHCTSLNGSYHHIQPLREIVESAKEMVEPCLKNIYSSHAKNMNKAIAMFQAATGSNGSLVYMPLKAHKRYHELYGGLYLYNLSGARIKLTQAALNYFHNMIYLLGTNERVQLYVAEEKEMLTNWGKRVEIFGTWNKGLQEVISLWHGWNDVKSSMQPDLKLRLNELPHYAELCNKNYFTAVKDKSTYDRIKKMSQNKASLAGFIAGLFERFSYDSVTLKLKFKDIIYENPLTIFPKINSELVLRDFDLKDEIGLVDFIFILTNCGLDREKADHREIMLNLSVIVNNRKTERIILQGKNIETTKMYPYVLDYDIHKGNEHKFGVGDSSKLFGHLFKDGKISIYNLYANRFLLPMVITPHDTIADKPIEIDIKKYPENINYYDWNKNKLSFKIAIECGA